MPSTISLSVVPFSSCPQSFPASGAFPMSQLFTSGGQSIEVSASTSVLLMLLNCGVGEDSWESLGLQGDPISPFWRRSVLRVHWKDWCWSWNSSTLATWCEELTHLKRPWFLERLRAGEGDDRGWGGWMASPTQWTWVWVNSGNWWWTGKPGMLRSLRSQRVSHDCVTELNRKKDELGELLNLILLMEFPVTMPSF